MADKAISELTAATQVTPNDRFVLEQNGTAKSLTGQVLENWLLSFADGHGGIQTIEKTKTSGLVDTYTITLADTTKITYTVTNGKGINSISKTSTKDLVDTYKITYTDGTSDTYTVTNGAKGDTGSASYVWIKYASQEPTESSHSIGDVPDNWIGIYAGTYSTAPTDWTQYQWFKIKGEKGNQGDPATLVSSEVVYQVSDSGTIIPSGEWSKSVPVVAQGKYLWTRTTSQFNTGDPVIAYSVARMGKDGAGSVSSVCNKSPDSDGNVALGATDVGALPSAGGDMTGAINMNGQKISGLNDPTGDTEAARKSYVDNLASAAAKKRLVSSTALATIPIGGNHTLKESIIGKEPVFAVLAYAPAIGRVGGSAGNRSISFSNVTSVTSGVNINLATFSVSDDGLTLSLRSSIQIKLTSSGPSVTENQSLYFGAVTLINA